MELKLWKIPFPSPFAEKGLRQPPQLLPPPPLSPNVFRALSEHWHLGRTGFLCERGPSLALGLCPFWSPTEALLGPHNGANCCYLEEEGCGDWRDALG